MARNHAKRPGQRPPGPHGARSAPASFARPEREKEGGPVWLWGTHAVLATAAASGPRVGLRAMLVARLGALRTHMTLFINNFYAYIQVKAA